MIKASNYFLRTRQSNLFIPSHTHTSYEFVYFFTGDGILEIDNKKVKFKANSYYFVGPNIPHSEFYETEGYSLVIRYDSDEPFNTSLLYGHDESHSLLHFINKIATEINNTNYGFESVINSVFNEMMIKLARKDINLSTKMNHMRIDDAVFFIDENYMNIVDINDLANKCGYTVDHFRILFKEKAGLNPKQYILDKRLSLAKKLLSEKKMSILEIGQMCGFESYSQFMAFFKKNTNITPKNYQDSCK